MNDPTANAARDYPTAVFAYGTLMFPEVAHRLAAVSGAGESAIAKGFRRYEARIRRRGNYPAVQHESDGHVDGLLLDGLSERQVAVFDWFEGIAAGLYTKEVTDVAVGDDSVPAIIYVCGPLLRQQLIYELRDPWDPAEFRDRELDWYIDHVVLPAIRSEEYQRLFGGGSSSD